MSNLLKIAIPLLNKDLTLNDIDKSNGFIDAYFEDINKPSLTYHMFLMYDYNCKSKDFSNILYKLNGLDNKYSMRIVYIKEKPYYVFTFTINKQIQLLRDGCILLNEKQKERVLKFWEWKDGWISNNVLLGVTYEHPEKSILPEEDYAPDFFDAYENREALIQCLPIIF